MKPCRLVHGWDMKKDNLRRKGFQRINLDFYGIALYYYEIFYAYNQNNIVLN
jgi:hypothetical protein